MFQRMWVLLIDKKSNKYRRKLLNTATKTGLHAVKTVSKKLIHKKAEMAGKFIENRWKNCETKTLPEFKKRWRNSYSTRENTRNVKQFRTNIIKWSAAKHVNY